MPDQGLGRVNRVDASAPVAILSGVEYIDVYALDRNDASEYFVLRYGIYDFPTEKPTQLVTLVSAPNPLTGADVLLNFTPDGEVQVKTDSYSFNWKL